MTGCVSGPRSCRRITSAAGCGALGAWLVQIGGAPGLLPVPVLGLLPVPPLSPGALSGGGRAGCRWPGGCSPLGAWLPFVRLFWCRRFAACPATDRRPQIAGAAAGSGKLPGPDCRVDFWGRTLLPLVIFRAYLYSPLIFRGPSYSLINFPGTIFNRAKFFRGRVYACVYINSPRFCCKIRTHAKIFWPFLHENRKLWHNIVQFMIYLPSVTAVQFYLLTNF